MNLLKMETQKEKAEQKLCKKNMVIESCSSCILEALCHYEEMKKRLEEENNEE
ncbi:hypothetical protein IKN40_03490 [bacterium]|nr:hypothetical protein [bacterium]